MSRRINITSTLNDYEGRSIPGSSVRKIHNNLYCAWTCPACLTESVEIIPVELCPVDVGGHLYANPQCPCGETVYSGEKLGEHLYASPLHVIGDGCYHVEQAAGAQ